MQTQLFDGFAESMDNLSKCQLGKLGFVGLLERSCRVSARLSNAIRSAAANGQLPYASLEAYLADGPDGRMKMSKVRSIGRKSVAELDLLIAEAYQYEAMQFSASYETKPKALSETNLSDFLSNYCGTNVQLVQAIHAAGATNALPYQTVKAYVEAAETGRVQMLKLEGVSETLLDELDGLLSDSGYRIATDADMAIEGLTGENSADNSDSRSIKNEILHLSLDEFLARQGAVSVRLLNAISTAVNSGRCPFEDIAAYLRCPSKQDQLRTIDNLGAGSAIEFERLVFQALGAGATAPIRINDHGYPDIGSIVRETISLLKANQKEVALGRLLEKKTLEAIASTRDVTRERVRQIEAKSLKIIQRKSAQVFGQAATAICAEFHKNALSELSIDDFAPLVTSTVSEAAIYLALLRKFHLHESSLSSFEGHVFVQKHYVPRASWKATLTEALKAEALPLALDSVLLNVRSVPSFYIRDYFRRKCGPKENMAGKVVPNYSTARMCVDVLRKAGSPLHTSDVRARICKVFQIDVEEHAINATLGRLRETLISAPGTYVLYESLPLTQSQIESVRNRAEEHLLAKGVFISSKILFDEAFLQTPEYESVLNHYLVMGIVQDDARFKTKRGNMVGLATFDLRKAYTPLQDEICKIVLQFGPITIPEISERLSATRRLCNDSGIRLVLTQSLEVIQIGRRTFDSLHRFFETREGYEDLLLAIRISLLEKRKTTFSIATDLHQLKFNKLTSHLVESLLQSMEDVESEGDIHALVCADGELQKYNSEVVHALSVRGTPEDIAARLRSTISADRLAKMLSLDCRFLMDLPVSGSPATMTELSSILNEFEF